MVPHHVGREIIGLFRVRECIAGILFEDIEKLAPRIAFAFDLHLLHVAILFERDAAVDQQIAVILKIQLPFFHEEVHMARQLLGMLDGEQQFIDDLLLFVEQAVGLFGIDRGEAGIFQRIGFAVDRHFISIVIDFFQEQAVFHREAGTPLDDRAFQFELDDRDRLVDLRDLQLFLLRQMLSRNTFWVERRVVFVILLRQIQQRAQIDAVHILDDVQVIIARTNADDVREADFGAGIGADPQHVMVPPLNVEGVVVDERIHDLMRIRPPVVNIADDVQMVDGQALHRIGEADDQFIHLPQGNDLLEHFRVIILFVGELVGLVQELFDDVDELLRQGFAQFRARVFG